MFSPQIVGIKQVMIKFNLLIPPPVILLKDSKSQFQVLSCCFFIPGTAWHKS